MTTQILNAALWCLKGVHNDKRIEGNGSYLCIRHSSNFVFYQRFSTVVPVSIFARAGLQEGRRVFLQKRGFRTGLLGWSVGTLLGGTWGKEIEITPVGSAKSLSAVSSDVLSSSTKTSIQKEIDAVPVDARAGMKLAETIICHVPAASGDGYFRIRVSESNSLVTVATTPTFRVLSSSLTTASPRGATIFQFPIETLAATSAKTAQIGAWGVFYAAFPFLKVASWLPGGTSQAAINYLWRWAGGQQKVDDARASYHVDEKLARAGELRDKADHAVPWGAIGIRRDFDLKADAELGRQGVSIRY